MERSGREAAPHIDRRQVFYQPTSALGRYVSDRERVLGRGSRLGLANRLLDIHRDDIDAAIDDLYEAARLRRGVA
jgi:hypothetical protein